MDLAPLDGLVDPPVSRVAPEVPRELCPVLHRAQAHAEAARQLDEAKARASLERAYGLQPRIRGGLRAKEAEAELAALSPKIPEVSP